MIKEINLFCDEHGYLGSSSWFGTLAWLAHIHLLTEGKHELSYSWGKEITEAEKIKKESLNRNTDTNLPV